MHIIPSFIIVFLVKPPRTKVRGFLPEAKILSTAFIPGLPPEADPPSAEKPRGFLRRGLNETAIFYFPYNFKNFLAHELWSNCFRAT
jgi:hypothetical protein